MSLTAWQVAVPGVQTVTLTHGLLRYELLVQSEPFTVMGRMLFPVEGRVTVRVAFPDLALREAVMVAEPEATPVAKPPLEIVAVPVLDEAHVTCGVMFWVDPSEYVPVAANCWAAPTRILAVAGVTPIDERVAAVTVRVVLPEILPEAAVMIAEPAAMAVARPLPLTVATEVFDELQVTPVVISRLVPSAYVPEAANCLVFPAGMFGLAGVTDIEDRVAGVTVRVVFPEILPEAAVMIAEPTAMAVARPLPLTVATDGSDEFQVTWRVRSRLVPSE